GPTAVLDVNDVKIILISLRWQTLDPEMIRVVGIDPTAEKVLVVKSSVHYRAAFEPLAHAVIEVDAPGLSTSNLGASRSRTYAGRSSRSTSSSRLDRGERRCRLQLSSRPISRSSTRRASSLECPRSEAASGPSSRRWAVAWRRR